MISPGTWVRVKRVEKEIKTLPLSSTLLHRRTVRGIALYEVLNYGVPVPSMVAGLATLAMFVFDNLKGQDLPIPSELEVAVRALASIQAELYEHAKSSGAI